MRNLSGQTPWGIIPAGILLIILWASPAFSQYFSIQRFHANIVIRPDSSVIVQETLEVSFERPRHGIYREIPFRYTDELGQKTVTPLRVLSVTEDSGKIWPYVVEKKGNVVHIRIGDPKRYVEGRQFYVITYRVENALLFFRDRDELYWNVTGNAWQAPIQEASADVTLSTEKRNHNLWGGCYTGFPGSRESLCTFEPNENRAQFTAQRPLKIGEGFTIALGWEKGFVSAPSSWKRFLWAVNLQENWIFLFPVLSLIFMTNQWVRRGRDPRVREAVKVIYEPPRLNGQPLNAGEVGALVDERIGPRDLTATLIGLAVKGYLKIEETKKEGLIFDSVDYRLVSLKDADAALTPFETSLMASLFSGKTRETSTAQLQNKFYKNIDGLKKTLYADLLRKGYFGVSPEKVRNRYARFGILVIIAGSITFSILAPHLGFKGVLAWILTGVPILAFSGAMPAKTKAGASAYMDILGFQEFMNRAEKDKIERLGEKDLFYTFLPYAIALGVADHWARAFEGLYQDPPQWYSSPLGPRLFSPSRFSHSLNGATASLASAMFSAPRGSGTGGGGHSGGGSSGGGFGGGGGGSW